MARKKCETRYAAAVSASFFAANILHPEYLGRTLTKSQLKHAGEWIKAEYPNAVSDFFDFIGDGRDKIEKEYETCVDRNQLGS